MRVNANALIIRDKSVLLVKFEDASGVHYNLPGGKIERGETAQEAAVRECREEVGMEIEVKELVLSWQYVPEKEKFAHGQKRKLGLVFRCEIKKEKMKPSRPDDNQVGFEWVSFANILAASDGKFPPIFPRIEKEVLDIAAGKTKSIPFLVSG